MPRQLKQTKSISIDINPEECNSKAILNSIQQKIPTSETAFYHVSLCSVLKQHERWKQFLPRVEPFFAVKCQPDPQIIRLLGQLGTGFDCASREEIKTVIKTLQWNPEIIAKQIIYANPFKFKKDIEFAKRAGVQLTTFDSESELIKLANEWPSAKLVLRVSPERQYDATCVLGNKFGADAYEIVDLLKKAKELAMDIVGICFHVGSGCKELEAFPETVQFCGRVIETARDLGFNPYLIDIGGGFPGYSEMATEAGLISAEKQLEFQTMTNRLTEALDQYFSADSGFRVIAEPGRYFVSGAYTLATQVIGKKGLNLLNPNNSNGVVACESMTNKIETDSAIGLASTLSHSSILDLTDNSSELGDNINPTQQSVPKFIECDLKGFRYVINDGVYNSFNNIVYDHAKPEPVGRFDMDLNWINMETAGTRFISTIYGPTCDGFDCIMSQVQMPEFSMSDWLIWPNMGAYTGAASSCFNGIQKPLSYYEFCESCFYRVGNNGNDDMATKSVASVETDNNTQLSVVS